MDLDFGDGLCEVREEPVAGDKTVEIPSCRCDSERLLGKRRRVALTGPKCDCCCSA